ncbi:D-amino acid oxidase [Nadsonia fulvescens var. elongata DSM 6958]|uniref:D-amino acid oxidase n=1 Tax=Nadsonia fulvescens var. elongata DSM 6958 TaxID=857566 RepID=A0A1E3PT09_9ASCO|nr:D-amino acid oxidase [Nadsonia fulvescens var. elongata DSM 6958]
MSKVVVIGAGVAGLTSALLLLKEGYDITIVARHLPGDLDIEYTSPWAGGNWSSFALPHETLLQDYDKAAYGEFHRLAKEAPEAGIWYQELSVEEIPEGYDYGFKFLSVVISTSRYLNYLWAQLAKGGVSFKRCTLSHISEANGLHSSGKKPDLIVNCTGLLAYKLGGVEDKNVYPIRGQTLLVRNQASKMMECDQVPGYPNELVYIMPRVEGGTIIGGTFWANDWSSNVDYDLSERMMKRALAICPDLIEGNNPSEMDIVRHNVGLRPGRIGGPRLEAENISGVGTVIHNYGAGGAGYQSSYGMALKVVGLAKKEKKITSKI